MAKRKLPKGWTEGTAQDFLGLSEEEATVVEIRVRLANRLREVRAKRRVSQRSVAAKIGSTQPRLCRAENGDASIELLIRSLVALGVNRKEIGREIANS